jgi:hypothetical protein
MADLDLDFYGNVEIGSEMRGLSRDEVEDGLNDTFLYKRNLC